MSQTANRLIDMIPRELRARLCLACALLPLVGCGKPDPGQRFVRPDHETKFEVLYERNCRGCHGVDGEKGAAPPLNDPLFLAIMPQAAMEDVVANGRQHSLMQAFVDVPGGPIKMADVKMEEITNKDKFPGSTGPLTPVQVKILVKDLRARWSKPDIAGDKLPTYSLSEAAPGNKDKGRRVFETACAGCHGDGGRGGPNGDVNDPVFLALISEQALRRIVITGRPDWGMPDYRSSTGRDKDFKPLTAEEISDVVALLVYWKQSEK